MVKEMAMEIRKMIVRLDVFEEDELMAYSQRAEEIRWVGMSEFGFQSSESLVIRV